MTLTPAERDENRQGLLDQLKLIEEELENSDGWGWNEEWYALKADKEEIRDKLRCNLPLECCERCYHRGRTC